MKSTFAVDSDGAEALEQLEKATPALVVLDLMMPGIDGFEVLERMRGEERWRHIPVLVFTAMDLNHHERARLEQRVAQVVHKGGSAKQELLAQVRQLVDGHIARKRP